MRFGFCITFSAILTCLGLFIACTNGSSEHPIAGTDTGNPIILSGTVFTPQGQPLANASLTLRQKSAYNTKSSNSLPKSSITFDTTFKKIHFNTNDSGMFLISDLIPGDYSLVVQATAPNLGVLHRFSLATSDSVYSLDSLPTQDLDTLKWAFPDSLAGRSVEIFELDLKVTLQSSPFVLVGVPAGTYTLIQANQWLDSVSTTATIHPAQGSSSSLVSSSSTNPLPQSSSSTVSNQVTDSRDNQVYELLSIGGTQWFARNLSYAIADSTPCSAVDPSESCNTYGRFYSFSQALEACPDGTRLPTLIDFQALFKITGGTLLAGAQLKSSSGWASTNGLDSFDFTAYPVGSALENEWGQSASFWTSDASDTTASAILFTDSSSAAQVLSQPITHQFSVRCIAE